MRVWIVFAIATMVLAAEGVPAAKKDAKAKPAPAAAKVTKIPDGAVQISPTSYRYTLPNGKTQLFVKSPFGIMKVDEQAMPAAVPASHADNNVKATVDGDTIHFERPSPFGIFRWDRKISDLNEEERAIWQAETSPSASAQD